MMKSSRENTGEEKRVMGGGGGDLIDWKLQAQRTPVELDEEKERRKTISA